MDPRSISRELHWSEEYQLAFTRDSCASCESHGGCPFSGTTYQCRAIPVLQDDIQPGSPEAHYWIRQLGGLDIRAQGQFAAPSLPGALPQVAVQHAAGPATRGVPWVALPLSQLLRSNGSQVSPKEEIIQRTGMDNDTLTILVMTGADAMLSTLSNDRNSLVASIRTSGHDLVLAPCFSIWDDHSPFHNRIQLAYIDRFGTALVEAGVRTVPAVCSYESADLHDFAAAMNANPSIETVWLDWQTVSHGRNWRRALGNLDALSRLLPKVRFIINGVSDRRQGLWERDYVMSLISFHEFMSAVSQNAGPEGWEAAQRNIQSFVHEGTAWRSTWRA